MEEKPENIFNVDETGFMCNRGDKQVLCQRGSKRVNSLCSNNEKAMYTVQVCCSASGTYLPLYVVYKGLHLYDNWCKDGPKDCHFDTSPSGWMEEAQFFEWFNNKVVIKFIS